jgi:diguanylate cyclase (GGDEF)-like protein
MNGSRSRRRWQRLSLRAKTIVVMAVPMALIVLAVPLMSFAQRESSRVEQDVEQAYRVRQRLAQVLQSLVDAETGIRGYLLTGDQEFLTTSNEGVASVPRAVRGLDVLLADETGPAERRLEDLHRLADDRIEVILETRAFAKRTPPGTIPERIIARGRELMDQIRVLIAQMDDAEATRLSNARSRLATAERMSFMLSVVLVPLAMFLTILVALRHTASLVRGIRRIEENTRRLERGQPLLAPPSGDDELARLGRVLDQTAVRLVEQEAQLRELALEDDLTGLPNRRAFQQIAAHELELAKRRSNATALLFADADGLKDVNDALGHSTGDEMLREVAGVLREELRAADLIARIGGDEFVVLLSPDSAQEGDAVLERIAKAVAERNGQVGRAYELGLSIGMSLFDPADPATVDELIERADADMYQVKRAKRLARASQSGEGTRIRPERVVDDRSDALRAARS